jgi:hypothetical protein
LPTTRNDVSGGAPSRRIRAKPKLLAGGGFALEEKRLEVRSGIDDVQFEHRRWHDFYRFLQGAEKDALVEEVMT